MYTFVDDNKPKGYYGAHYNHFDTETILYRFYKLSHCDRTEQKERYSMEENIFFRILNCVDNIDDKIQY